MLEIEDLAQSGIADYKLFTIKSDIPGKKGRKIEWPKPRLFKIAKRLNELLARIETPSYLHSGVKGRSYMTNATSHRSDVPLAKIDIRSFYKSASSLYVFQCFFHRFQCSSDVAAVLYKLTTLTGFLPTGSPTSVLLSFYAYKGMFDKIYSLAQSRGLQMSLCVDDMTFSGAGAGSEFLYSVRGIAKRYGLQVHKRHCFSSSQNKIVTGVTLTSNGPRLPNKRRLKVFETVNAFNFATNEKQQLQLATTTMGRVAEASQLEPKTFAPIFRHIKTTVTKLRNSSRENRSKA